MRALLNETLLPTWDWPKAESPAASKTFTLTTPLALL
jgi:hypothetical protein